NFRSDVVNNGTLIFDTGTLGTTGVWNFTKSFADPDGSGSQTAPESQDLMISGTGSVEKTGNGILRLGGSLTESQQIGGSLTVRNGTLQISGRATQIGGALIVKGDSGLNRNVNLLGATTISGGIDATGRYNNVGSAINIRGTVFTEGDQGASVFQDGVATINGAIKLNYIDLILGSDYSIGKTSGSGTSGSTSVTVTNSSSLVVGMRVSGSGVQSGTVITAINPVTRVVTLNKSATIPGGTSLTFDYSSNTDGVISGTPTSLTLIGRQNTIGLTSNTGRLVLNNSQYSRNSNRIPDSTPIFTKGGGIEFINDGTNLAFSENLGALTLSQGQAQVISYQAGASGSSTLTFASLARNAGATIEFAGLEMSGSAKNTVTSALGTGVRNRIIFTTVPSIEAGTIDDGIIGGWAYANNEFVKYGANGITPLVSGDYETGAATVWTYSKNVKVQSTTTLSNTTGHRAINSLNIQPTGAVATNLTITLNNSKILSIESGGLLSNNGNHSINGTASYLTVGTASDKPAELIAIVGNNSNSSPTTANALTINTAIQDFSFTQSTTGVGMATGSFTMTVPAELFSLLTVGMTINNANLPSGTKITAINRSGGGTTITLSNSPSATIASSASSPVTFSGGSVGLTKSGPGTLILSSTLENKYSGPTVINNGILRLLIGTNLGAIPGNASSNHIQLNGGTLQFGANALGGVQTSPAPDKIYALTDGNRGVSIGEAGGRIEVGHLAPNPDSEANNGAVPIVKVTITNPIHAEGLLELAVRSNVPLGKYNELTLGNASSNNIYAGGIKTEGSYDGIITINGNNNINGLFMEGADVILPNNNNFTGTIRILTGNLTLNGSNTYNGQPNFTETIEISGGTLNLGSSSALGTSGFNVIMANTSQLRLLGTNQTILSLSGDAKSVISNGGAAASILTVDIPVNQTFNGTLENKGAGALSLTKTGPGRLSLTNNESSFSGNVLILDGVVDVTTIGFTSNESALGRGYEGLASEIVLDGGALSFSPKKQQFTDRSFSIGAGTNGATLVANGINQAARLILGIDYVYDPGGINERVVSKPIGFVGTGSRTLTLSGFNIGDNEFQLELGDNSLSEPTSLLKIGSGTWALGKAGSYSGQTTVQEGVLAILSNNVLGTTSISTIVNSSDDTFTGNMPDGVEISFPSYVTTTLPKELQADKRYYVVNSSEINSTFQVAATRGGDYTDLTSSGTNVQFVPNIQSVASTVANSSTGTFTGNLPNGTAVVFGTQIPRRLAISGTLNAALPGGINANTTYYVVQATGTTFRVSATLGGSAITLTNSGQGDIYYTATLIGNTSSGINVVGGRLELRNVDYITPETITFQGGAFSLPRDTTARWTGNMDVQANTTFTIGVNSEFIFDGNLLGTRAITQLGEGTVRLRGETITPTAASSVITEMENSRRSYTVQAGTLILDYSLNNNSKLIDTATLVLGGGRRGGVLRLQGGSHEEIVNALSISSGANQIYRDSGTSTIRLNTISRAEGASLYFDLSRIATVDNLNINNILGGWAIIRDALSQATWVLPGTVVRDILTTGIDVESNTLTIKPAAIPLGIHYLGDGAPVRFTSTGTLPAPLMIDTTYYITNAGANSFKVSATVFGKPIDIVDVGSDGAVLTVSSYAAVKRLGPATLTFTANPDNYPGSSGNDVFSIEIQNVANTGAITSTVSGPAQPTPATPRVYKII
ncbi:MAG: autotransporter-associated beta strand repeat-containing protein, partial [Prosthecobacter sp.]|nr:autotransporter-associated beta strand repeat-containing protein [Prosthecobacter sp.]